MEFEWDAAKAARNIVKHGVSFEIVRRLDWAKAITRPDDRADYGEQRWRALHTDADGTHYVIVFTERGGAFRIISARRAHAKEVRTWARC
jgi:uncharacterized DUF497 family protein